MVRDQHVNAARVRGCHTVDAAHAVIDRDDQMRRASSGQRDDLGREAVAELEAVGDEIVDLRAHCDEAAHADRAGGCAVRVVIGDDQHALAALDRIGEPLRGGFDALERTPRRQERQINVQLGDRKHAARGVDARKHRRHPRSDERRCGSGDWTAHDLHGAL